MGYSNIDLSGDLQGLTDSANMARDDISKYINNPDGDNEELTKKLSDIHNNMSNYTGNILTKSYEIQENATNQSKNAAFYLDRGNTYLNDLVEESNHEVNELKIQKDNKKRIIEMQRNRLFKYQFIKQTLLYLIGVILVCGVILYVEKIFKNSVKPITSGLLVAIASIFSIFMIFRIVDYMRRSKFNFRQYDVLIGGDKYKKSVYRYDMDEIQSMGDYALDEIDSGIDSGIDSLQKNVKKLKRKDNDDDDDE
tara:strand:+ start:471 stop:1226 length:756 start_codon:yes stop_codon:yes gene_type:complete